jgi:inositol-phosphate phosphatase / L-galactose 1-phosphate phosphatase / histidinol-phosphatase
MSTAQNYTQWAQTAATLVVEAGKLAAVAFRGVYTDATKQDASPVTAIDEAIEAQLIEGLRRHFPSHGIVGEETGVTQGEAEVLWHIDPLDGTKAFMAGKQHFGVLLGCTVAGVPVLGLMYQPITQELWMGVAGQPLHYNRAGQVYSQPPRLAPLDLKATILATTGPQYFDPAQKAVFDKIAAQCRFVSYGGDCYNYGLLALGCVDLVMEAGLKSYDILPLIPIIESSGGVVTDWRGASIRYPFNLGQTTTVIAARERGLLDKILAVVV